MDLHSQPLLDDLRNEVCGWRLLLCYQRVFKIAQVLQRYAGFHIPKSDLPNTTRAALGLSVRGSSKTKQKPTPASGRDEEEDAVIDWSEFEEALGYDGSPIPSGSVHLSSDDHQDLSEDDIAQLRPNVTEKVIQQAEIGHLIHLSDVLPTLPPRGPFDIKQVGESSYFFS